MTMRKNTPEKTIETVGLKFDNGKVSCGPAGVFQLVEQYNTTSAGVLGLFPNEYKFFSGRQFQWNDKIKQYEYFSAVIIVEFSIGKQKYYVSGENFYDSVEQAVLMKNYILNNKRSK